MGGCVDEGTPFLFATLALRQIEDEADCQPRVELQFGGAEEDRDAGAIAADVLLLEWRTDAAFYQLGDPAGVPLGILGWRHLRPAQPAAVQLLSRIPHHLQKVVI